MMLTHEVQKHTDAVLFDKLKWLDSKEAATYLRVSVGQLRNMVWQGRIKAYRLSSRLRFLRSDLDWLMTRPLSPRPIMRYKG